MVMRAGRRRLIVALVSAPVWLASGAGLAQGADALSQMQQARQTLAALGMARLEGFSTQLRAAIVQADAALRGRRWAAVLDALKPLESVAPLEQVPSYDAQLLASAAYLGLGDAARAARHHALAQAMRELLLARLGDAKTPRTALQILMVNDLVEWAGLKRLRIVGMKGFMSRGRPAYEITYRPDEGQGLDAQAYAQFDERIAAARR